MTMTLFDQFAPTTFLGVSTTTIAILATWLFLSPSSTRWLSPRALTIETWFFKAFIKEILSPISTAGHSWAIMLTSLTTFLLEMNFLGLLPYTFSPTTQLSLNLGLALPLWLLTIITGLHNQLPESIGHLLPEGTPTPLIPILVVIETISLLIRPLTLAIRLTANITAGHLLIQLISTTTMFLFPSPLSLGSYTALTLLLVLEIFVAVAQAFVFAMLVSLYLQENTSHTNTP